MTSKWIEELEDVYSDGGDWEDFLPILLRIDRLLKVAMLSVDKNWLYDKIHEEVRTYHEGLLDSKKFTGVSEVVPVTEAEALRIMRDLEKKFRKEEDEEQL